MVATLLATVEGMYITLTPFPYMAACHGIGDTLLCSMQTLMCVMSCPRHQAYT